MALYHLQTRATSCDKNKVLAATSCDKNKVLAATSCDQNKVLAACRQLIVVLVC